MLMNRSSSMQNGLTDPVTLTFVLLTQCKSIRRRVARPASQDHSLYKVWTRWDHSFRRYAADKQTDRRTDKQTDSNILPTPTDIVGMGTMETVGKVLTRDVRLDTISHN